MTDDGRVTLQVSRRFSASPERVFDAWLDPASARNWLFSTPTGEMVRAEVDPRVGGAFVFTERRDGTDVDHVGRYIEIERPRRLVFTFAVPAFSRETSEVEVEITPRGEGCELVLTQRGVVAEFRDRSAQGWAGILEGLARALG